VYAAFDAAGRAAPHAVAQLAEYRGLGFETLVVDTSPTLSAQREQDWRQIATDWQQRPNVGYDFISYRFGLETLIDRMGVDVERLSLILANDSCFGPFIPLRGVLEAFDALPRERPRLFGITENHEIRRHLQSYWLYMKPDVAPLVFEFLRAMRIPKTAPRPSRSASWRCRTTLCRKDANCMPTCRLATCWTASPAFAVTCRRSRNWDCAAS
jgi:lipopolysaccharide biosynthesis protein